MHKSAAHNLCHGEAFLLVQSSVGGGDWDGRCLQSPRPSHCARRHRRSSPRVTLWSLLDRRRRWNTWSTEERNRACLHLKTHSKEMDDRKVK